MPNGQIFAVRKIHQPEPNSGVLDIPLRFENETDVLTKLRHRNIVKLYGYCSHARHTFLVYEFLGGGSLYEILITDEKAMELQWIKQMNILKDVSKAISCMHHDFFPSIVHRDISSKNILLDSKQNAHVSDFGTAKFLRLDSSNWTPELAYITEVNAKSDVYSFGMLALKVIMGKRPGDFISSICFESALSSVIITRDTLFKDVLDQRVSISNKKVEDEVALIATIALSCVRHSPQSRPTMQQVSQELSKERLPFKTEFSTMTIGQLLDHKLSNF